jgi:hypothetical protein
MKKILSQRTIKIGSFLAIACFSFSLMSSSHREAPLIADDPTADNTDVYAFRSPTDQNKVVLIANYIPFQLPDGGPNYYHFAEDVRYEIHVDNNVATPGDDITYRWTFKRTNEDPTTFFSLRLGKENLKTTYTLERSKGGGAFQAIVTNGVVPPYNVGPRSIMSPVGLNAPSYESLMMNAIKTASTGEKVFAGPVDDPFFVDAGGIFDLGDAPRTTGSRPKDVLRRKNVHTLALEVDIATLQKDGKTASQAQNILDGDYVIGVWASASRQKMRVLNGDGTQTNSGDWVQISRLGMPLTNEAVIPIGFKDRWNSMTPYQDLAALATYGNFFYNPELALYMDDSKFGGAVPALKPLRIQRNSLGAFGFGNDQNGLYPLKGTSALAGTALDDAIIGTLLLPGPGKPRTVDLWPIFHTGVPNLIPYQLATGKGGNPLAKGKPFINNFLPNGGDMLRLNMAVPVTPRNSPDFSNEGLLQAAVLGLTDPRFNTNTNIQVIPNMDGFPNGRRLEDDVTRIELQAVSGIVLAAIGLPYDDYLPTRRLRAIVEFNNPNMPAGLGLGLLGVFNGHSYYLTEGKYTFTEASTLAKSRGGYLVAISSQAENDFVRTYVYSDIFKNDQSLQTNVDFNTDINRGVLTGLNDVANEGMFVNDNGEPVTYTNFDAGQPSASDPGEDFVIVQYNGRWNDVDQGSTNLVTPQLINVLTYNTRINRNDTALKTVFPFEQTPWPGTFNDNCNYEDQSNPMLPASSAPVTNVPILEKMGLTVSDIIASVYPNPTTNRSTVRYRIASASNVQIMVSDAQGKPVKVLTNQKQNAGTYTVDWNTAGVAKGVYFISILKNGELKQTIRIVKG